MACEKCGEYSKEVRESILNKLENWAESYKYINKEDLLSKIEEIRDE